jgi:acetyl esterase
VAIALMNLTKLAVFALLSAAAVFSAEPKPLIGEARVYKRVGDRELKVHIVKPDAWRATDRRPAIVFFFGGGWVQGAPTQFNEHSRYFASRGLVCLQVEYRLVARGLPEPPLVCVQDARSSMRWVRSHATELGIDPNRIASAGGSSGGHLAAHVGMVDALDDPADDRSVSPKSNAMILFNPVLDNGPGEFAAKSIGARYPEFSPAHNISADDPPMILFLGSQDKLIPVSTVERLKANMAKVGVRCELRIYEGQGHGFFNAKDGGGKYYALTVREADRFLASLGWLKGDPTLAAPTDDTAR